MFLDQTGISNSQFADTCEIPRPTLSQLLNGRNKKVSDEVISKIHRAYPSLNVMWLMFGDGEMILGGGDNNNEQTDNTSIALKNQGGQSEDMGPRGAISFDDDEPVGFRQATKTAQRIPSTSSMNETIQSIMRNNSAVRMPQRGGASAPDDRSVVNIVVFYNDGRFEQFGPLK